MLSPTLCGIAYLLFVVQQRYRVLIHNVYSISHIETGVKTLSWFKFLLLIHFNNWSLLSVSFMEKDLLGWHIVTWPEMPTNMCIHLHWRADYWMNR